MIVLMLLAATLGAAVARPMQSAEDCRGIANGVVVAWGCRSYTICRNQRPFQIDCHAAGLVYNPRTRQCDNKLNTPAPCGLYRDCRGKADGQYADRYVNCTAFFTCKDNIFFGHQMCNPGLVFNEKLQICDWPYNVERPCGTKGGPIKPVPMDSRSKNAAKKPLKMKIAMTKEEMVDFVSHALRSQHKNLDVSDVKTYRNREDRKAAIVSQLMAYREFVHGL